MSANIDPIFPLTPNSGGVSITASASANTKSNGTGTIGTDLFKVFTAGANGAQLKSLTFQAVATAASTVITATVLRFFLSSLASGVTTGGTDTFLLAEVPLASFTADAPTAVNAAMGNVPLPGGALLVPAGWTILMATHVVPAASSEYQALAVGANF